MMVLLTMNLKLGASPDGDAVSEIRVCRIWDMIVSFHDAVVWWL
jgi:hypothetical protein